MAFLACGLIQANTFEIVVSSEVLQIQISVKILFVSFHQERTSDSDRLSEKREDSKLVYYIQVKHPIF